jgi:putative transposase
VPDNNNMIVKAESAMTGELRKVLKRLHYPLEVMLVCARRYAAYPLSLRHIEEMMHERGVLVDHATGHRWALKILPILTLIFRSRKRAVGTSWRLDETYIKVAGQRKYRYRAVDKAGDTVDFLLTAKRDKAAAQRYLERAINCMACQRRSPLTKAVSTPLPSMASIKPPAWPSNFVNQNT